MAEMKTLNGYEIVDAKAREDIEVLKNTDFDFSPYAKKEDIPSLEGLATETYVDEQIANADISEKLNDYALKSEVPSIEGLATEDYVQDLTSGIKTYFFDFSTLTTTATPASLELTEFAEYVVNNADKRVQVYIKDSNGTGTFTNKTLCYVPAIIESEDDYSINLYKCIVPLLEITRNWREITYDVITLSKADGVWSVRKNGDNEVKFVTETTLAKKKYATQTYVGEQIAAIDFPETDLTNYYNKQEVDTAITQAVPNTSEFITRSEASNQFLEESDLASYNYATKTDIPTKVSAFNNDMGYITQHQDISGKADKGHTHTLAQITDYKAPDLTPYALQKDLDAAELTHQADINSINGNLNNNYWTSTRVGQEITFATNNLKSEIPSKVSQLTNDAGYLTEHQSLEGYATVNMVLTKVGEVDADLDALDGRVSTIESNYVTNTEKETIVSTIKNWHSYDSVTVPTGEINKDIYHIKFSLRWFDSETYSYSTETFDTFSGAAGTGFPISLTTSDKYYAYSAYLKANISWKWTNNKLAVTNEDTGTVITNNVYSVHYWY